jgi:SAM-dependent methyltransferase
MRADSSPQHSSEQIRLKGEDWYDHPKWYDILHARGTAAEVTGVEAIAERFAGWDREDRYLNLLEPGCGTGRHLRVAARRGHQCWGIDLSEPMLAYARHNLDQAGLKATLVDLDMASFTAADLKLGHQRIDVALCFINSVRHLPTEESIVSHLKSVSRVLSREGVYAVGVGLAAYGSEQESEDVWKGSRGRCSVTQMVQYLPPPNLVVGDRGSEIEPMRNERVVSQLAITTPSREVFISHTFSLRTYSAAEWEAVLRKAGMRVVGLVDEFGDDLDWDWRSGTHGYAVFVLRPSLYA